MNVPDVTADAYRIIIAVPSRLPPWSHALNYEV